MRDLAKPFHQVKRTLVVKILTLVGDVLRELSKPVDRLFPVGSATFLTCNTTLESPQLSLSLAIMLRWLDFVSFRIHKERLQSKINANGRKLGSFNLYVGQLVTSAAHGRQLAGENDVPAVAFFLESHGLDLTFNRSVHLDLDVANLLEIRLIVQSKLAPVANGVLNRIKLSPPFESRIARSFAGFNSTKERLKRSVKTLQGSLARCRIGKSKKRINLPFLCQYLALLREIQGSLLRFVPFLTLGQRIVVQMPMCLQELKHNA